MNFWQIISPTWWSELQKCWLTYGHSARIANTEVHTVCIWFHLSLKSSKQVTKQYIRDDKATAGKHLEIMHECPQAWITYGFLFNPLLATQHEVSHLSDTYASGKHLFIWQSEYVYFPNYSFNLDKSLWKLNSTLKLKLSLFSWWSFASSFTMKSGFLNGYFALYHIFIWRICSDSVDKTENSSQVYHKILIRLFT